MGLNVAVRLWLPGESAIRVRGCSRRSRASCSSSSSRATRRAAERRRLRRVALALVGLLVAAALWATAVLVYDLIDGHRA